MFSNGLERVHASQRDSCVECRSSVLPSGQVPLCDVLEARFPGFPFQWMRVQTLGGRGSSGLVPSEGSLGRSTPMASRFPFRRLCIKWLGIDQSTDGTFRRTPTSSGAWMPAAFPLVASANSPQDVNILRLVVAPSGAHQDSRFIVARGVRQTYCVVKGPPLESVREVHAGGAGQTWH